MRLGHNGGVKAASTLQVSNPDCEDAAVTTTLAGRTHRVDGNALVCRPPATEGSVEKLSDDERERLRSLVKERGLSAVAKSFASSRAAVAAALVPLETRRGTIALLRDGLRRESHNSKPPTAA